jgi:putative phosphotransacetylase
MVTLVVGDFYMIYEVSVGVSNRHVHLNAETYRSLFDDDMSLYKPLNQIGQYASDKKVTIRTQENEIKNVRIVGPLRSYNQVEISKSDARKLGINPPVRDSGDLTEASKVTLVTDKSSVSVDACILARRHVHMNSEKAESLGVKNHQEVKLIVDGPKGGILNANVKVSDDGFYETHIDTDEAAAFGLENGSVISLEI